MKKTLSILAAVGLMFFTASTVLAQSAKKISGTYKMTGIGKLQETAEDFSDGSVTLKMTDESTVDLTQTISGSPTTITGLTVELKDDVYYIFLANSGGCIFGTITDSKLEYSIMYKEDDGKTNALQVYGKKK